MDIENILIGVVALIVVIVVVRFLTKKVFKIVLSLIVLIALGLFGYIYMTGVHTIGALEEKYCSGTDNKADSLKCVCIVQPISEDFHERLSAEELEEMNSIDFAKELSKSLVRKRTVIQAKLKENNALHLLDDFKKDFLKKNLDLE